jgi:hypothetical protein
MPPKKDKHIRITTHAVDTITLPRLFSVEYKSISCYLEKIKNIAKDVTAVITNKLIPIKELEAKIILGTLLELLKRNTAVTGKSNPKKQEKEINILVKFVGVKEPKMEEGCLFITSHPGTHSKILKT